MAPHKVTIEQTIDVQDVVNIAEQAAEVIMKIYETPTED